MPNPTRIEDIYIHGNELEKLEKDLVAADMAYTEFVQKIKQTTGEIEAGIKKLNPNRKKDQEAIAKSAKQVDQLQAAYKKYNKSLDENAVELAKVRAATREQNQIAKLQAQLATSVEGSYNNLSAQYRLNKIELNKLTAEERENNKEAKELEEQTKAIFEEMKRLQEATGKTSLNVGNYAEAIDDATGGTLGLNKVLTLISKNPFILVLSLIVGSLTALFKAFQRTERGAQLFARITGVLSGIMSELIGFVDRFAGAAIAAFEDPKQAMEDFKDFLVSQIVNRFLALPKLLGAVGKALTAVWERDMDKLKEAGVDAFQAVTQSITGLDAEAQNNLVEAFAETTREVIATADAMGDLAVQKRNLEKVTGELGVALAKTNIELEKQRLIADDGTRSFKEREEANERALVQLQKSAEIEVAIAKTRLGLLNTEIELRRRNGEDVLALVGQQLDAQRTLVEAEGQLTIAILENEKVRRELVQDRLERDLDILIDGVDNQKAINERLLADDRLTLEQRSRIFRETVALFNGSFDSQIATIQKFTDLQIDANDLIQTSDARTLNSKIRALGLSEIIEGRLLEVIRDRRTGLQDLADAQLELAQRIEVSALADNRFTNALTVGNEGVAERVKLLSAQSKLGIEAAKENAMELDSFLKGFRESIKPDEDEKVGLFEALGFDLSEGGKEALKSAFDFAKDQLTGFFAKRVELTNKLVDKRKEETDDAQANLDTQLALLEAGETAQVATAQRQLEQAKANQEKAEEQQRRAAKAQERIQTIQQTGNLITMVSKIYGQLPFPFGLAAAALMLGSFTAAKLKVAGLTRRLFRKGGKIDVKGGSHESGDDTFIGTHNGVDNYAEGGEKIGIFSRQAVAKHGPAIDDAIDMFNNGGSAPADVRQVYNIGSSNYQIQTRAMEATLKSIDKKVGDSTIVTQDGKIIRERGNHISITNV